MKSPPRFTERLERRNQLWWRPPWPGRGRGLADAAHRLRERRRFRRREDPEAAWHCCERWPRTLLNKWNAREFAARHGCDLPQLYWSGRDHARAPLESLPADFVIRPAFGAFKRGVSVVAGELELLMNEPVDRRALRERLPRSRRLRRSLPVLIEELIRTEEDPRSMPIECKLHTFAGHVGCVERMERHVGHNARNRYYTPAWKPIDDRVTSYLAEYDTRDHEPPDGLERMLELASAMGRELGTYMRIDFFDSDRGPVFNEFSSLPLMGRHYTPRGDELLGELWNLHCPAAV